MMGIYQRSEAIPPILSFETVPITGDNPHTLTFVAYSTPSGDRLRTENMEGTTDSFASSRRWFLPRFLERMKRRSSMTWNKASMDLMKPKSDETQGKAWLCGWATGRRGTGKPGTRDSLGTWCLHMYSAYILFSLIRDILVFNLVQSDGWPPHTSIALTVSTCWRPVLLFGNTMLLCLSGLSHMLAFQYRNLCKACAFWRLWTVSLVKRICFL